MIKRGLRANNIPYEADNLSQCFHLIRFVGREIGWNLLHTNSFLWDFTEKLTNKMISKKYEIIFSNLYENLLKNNSHIEFDKIVVKFLLRP